MSGGAPVSRGGEHPQDDVSAVHPDDGTGGVQQVEVEVGVAGDGAVQAGLQEGRPLLLQDALGAAPIPLAHPGHAGHHHLRSIGHGKMSRHRARARRPLRAELRGSSSKTPTLSSTTSAGGHDSGASGR